MKTLVTVGCSSFCFDRLFQIIDNLCDRGVLNSDEITAQTGKINYSIRNYRHFDFTGNDEMSKMQEEADLIICHAGTGTVTGALKKGKKVIVFPRLEKYHEHESDHQLDLAREFTEQDYVLCAMNEAELERAIGQIDSFTPKPFVSNRENFCNLIRSLL